MFVLMSEGLLLDFDSKITNFVVSETRKSCFLPKINKIIQQLHMFQDITIFLAEKVFLLKNKICRLSTKSLDEG